MCTRLALRRVEGFVRSENSWLGVVRVAGVEGDCFKVGVQMGLQL